MAFLTGLVGDLVFPFESPALGRLLMAPRAVDSCLSVRSRDPVLMVFRIQCKFLRRVCLLSRVGVQEFRDLGLGNPVAQITGSEDGFSLEIGFVEVLGKEVLVERAIVVEIVAARCRAGVEGIVFVAFAFFGDFLMAMEAIVFGKGDSHVVGPMCAMFDVAGDTFSRVDLLELVGFSWIRELAFGVGIVCLIKVVSVAIEACLLLDSHHGCMTGVAVQFDLVVTIRRFSRQIDRAI